MHRRYKLLNLLSRSPNVSHFGFLILLLLVVQVTLYLPTYAQDIPAGEEIDDREIMFAVESELHLYESVPAHLIDVETMNGVVTLSGTMSNLLAHEQAAKLVGTIKGVRAVVNDIVVLESDRSDADIRSDVVEPLTTDPATDAYEIDVSVEEGVVQLTGTVQSAQKRDLADYVASGVRGVLAVENDLIIEYGAERSDEEIAAEIERRFDADVWVSSRGIDIEVNDGVVMLDGAVGSVAEKRRVKADAWVMGVDSVDVSGLEINWWDRETMRREAIYAELSDDDVRKSVRTALAYDPRVALDNVTVDVNDGEVDLSGAVDNVIAKIAAGRDARNTRGVWRVNNYIRVRPDGIPSDDDLEDRVEAALRRDPYVEVYEIDVDVMNGRAILAGEVSNSYEAEHAVDVAWRVNGIADVTSTIDFEHVWTPADDYEIRKAVLDQFGWSPVVDETDLTVTVENGVVTLTGTVDSWQERVAAQRNAYEAGAKDVVNDLELAPNVPRPDYVMP